MSTLGLIQRIEVPTPFPVGPVNVYLVHGARLTLIDCGPGTPEAWAALLDGVQGAGVALGDIAHIVLTHHHPDHSWGLPMLLAALDYPVPVSAHPSIDRWLMPVPADLVERAAFWRHFYRQAGVSGTVMDALIARDHAMAQHAPHRSITHPLPAGATVALGDDVWQVHHTPGHASTQIGLYRTTDHAFIGGDHLLQRISSNALTEPPAPGLLFDQRPRTLLIYRKALSALLSLPLGTIYPGHGAPFSGAHALIAQRLADHHARAAAIVRQIEHGADTTLALSRALFPRLDDNNLFLGLSEVTGHLDLLIQDGAVVGQVDGAGVLHWRIVADR